MMAGKYAGVSTNAMKSSSVAGTRPGRGCRIPMNKDSEAETLTLVIIRRGNSDAGVAAKIRLQQLVPVFVRTSCDWDNSWMAAQSMESAISLDGEDLRLLANLISDVSHVTESYCLRLKSVATFLGEHVVDHAGNKASADAAALAAQTEGAFQSKQNEFESLIQQSRQIRIQQMERPPSALTPEQQQHHHQQLLQRHQQQLQQLNVAANASGAQSSGSQPVMPLQNDGTPQLWSPSGTGGAPTNPWPAAVRPPVLRFFVTDGCRWSFGSRMAKRSSNVCYVSSSPSPW